MPVLGSAIAMHLSRLKGLYSVELPISMLDEMKDLVRGCNESAANRALLVTDEPPDHDVTTIAWTQILEWRTDDDRVFVWRRGSQEPDTSFRSVVRPFISGRFPGSTGGECTLDLFARLSVMELWKRRGFAAVSEAFDEFLATAIWVAGVLRYSFEQVGSTPSIHWSDRFLKHWAQMLNQLDDGLDNLGSAPQRRHAWEIVRLSGLPVPSKIAKVGNPFLDAPDAKDFLEKDWSRFAKEWQGIVEDFILPEGAIAVLLAALDQKVAGAGTTTTWRHLDWNNISQLPLEAAAPEVGRAVFAASSSPTLLSPQSPVYPVAPIPSWWGVTSNDISGAADILRGAKPLQPDPNCVVLVQAFPGDLQYYFLRTRAGALSQAHTSRTWKAQILVNDLLVVFREDWPGLNVSSFEPTGALRDGEAWINPDHVTLEPKGKGATVSNKQVFTAAGNQLATRCNLTVEYTATKDNSSAIMTGKWDPLRSFKLKAKVRNYINGMWGPTRDIESSFILIIPSPFSPTILVAKQGKKALLAPDSGDDYIAPINTTENWNAESTPDILLEKEGEYQVSIYDGRITPGSLQFTLITTPSIKGTLSTPSSGAECFSWSGELDDGDAITGSSTEGDYDIAVIRIKERSGNLSSGILSAVRGLPAGRRPPSNESRSSFLGQYQVQVARTLSVASSGTHNSLYQYVVSSTNALEKWPEHSGASSPKLLPDLQPESLLGIGSGPSQSLVNCAEWAQFMNTIAKICEVIRLGPTDSEFWLSGFDPTNISAPSIKEYVISHRDLLRTAKNISPQDAFWASYPFSVVIVNGSPGASLGQLLAVLLSPLHPLRLAWTFAVAVTARLGDVDPSLLGLAEGWNIPYTGRAINPAGQEIPMVAVPTDPGPEQDFAAWSALAVLNTAGLADLPAFAAGLPLPWGGRTGMNDKVVERATRDYLAVHPHVSSLEVDIRSVSQAPRSREIDEAVLRFAGTGTLHELRELGGGTRVWDSNYRIGAPPTRDRLFALRAEREISGSFEWRRYSPPEIPANADIAFIENSSVHLAIKDGTVLGVISPLPLRRFCPPVLQNVVLDQNYSANPEDDILGLSELLAELEYTQQSPYAALRATPQTSALGIGMGARWEVLGTSNLDPSLLSSVVATRDQASGNRLLWEWRPSWLSQSPKGDLASRPYYVVAKIPASLSKALEYLYGFSADQANEMLSKLGRRGIGLASLQAAGGNQASAAAGFFYALSLLLPSADQGLPADWILASDTRTIHGLVPIDPLESIIEGMAGTRLQHRADLLAVRIVRSDDITRICFIPAEVKHHGGPGNPEPIPANSDSELGRARSQLAETAEVLEAVASVIHPLSSNPASIIGSCARRLGLAMILDLAMSFAPLQPPVDERANILRDVVNGRVLVGVGHPVLFWFAPGSIALNGSACVVDPYGSITKNDKTLRELFIDPHSISGLWWRGEPTGPNEEDVRTKVDEVMRSALSECNTVIAQPTGDFRPALMQALGFGAQPIAGQEPPDPASREGGGPDTQPEIDSPDPSKSVEDLKETEESGAQLQDQHEAPKESRVQAKERAEEIEQQTLQIPRAFIGWTTSTHRWTLIGKLDGDEPVGLDLDHPKAVGIFGYMGSGKSYLLGTLIEAALEPIPMINVLPNPLAVVIFNYRRNASDRFELSSLALENQDVEDTARLVSDYGATPQIVRDIQILCLPGELNRERIQEYAGLPTSELFFNPDVLTVEDWELLMGEPGSEAVFARTIRHALIELRSAGGVSLENLEHYVVTRLTGRSRTAASLRFDFVRRYISADRGIRFEEVLRPGRAVIVDLRQPLFNKADALRFFLICANQVSQVQGQFNKLVVFDEAHEYMSDEFGEKIDARVRQMRHEGTSYIFATQDVESIPQAIRRFITTRFVFGLGTRENVDDLLRLAPEFRGHELLGMNPGSCLAQANQSIGAFFKRPRLVQVRPRITHHGGASRIFSNGPLGE